MDKWRIKNSQRVLDTEWMRVRLDTCILPTGVCVEYYLWEGQDFAMIFGLTQDQEVLLVRQYKHGVQDIVVELPAGVIDESDEDPLSAAKRELKEETGYEAEDYTYLSALFVASAKAPTRAHLYLATGLRPVGSAQPDSQEEIETILVPVSELLQMIGSGMVKDVNSIAATFLALQRISYLELKPVIPLTSTRIACSDASLTDSK